VQRESLERYLTTRIKGVGPSRAAQLVEAHGVDILRHLDSSNAELAIKKLSAISGVGRKTAEQMLRSWTLNTKRGVLLCRTVLDGNSVRVPCTLQRNNLRCSPARAHFLLLSLLASVCSMLSNA
jgi:ribosomal protein S13